MIPSNGQSIINVKNLPAVVEHKHNKLISNKMVTIPLVPMIAISFVTLLDNFCNTLVNPIIPYLCKVYFPDVGFFCDFDT